MPYTPVAYDRQEFTSGFMCARGAQDLMGVRTIPSRGEQTLFFDVDYPADEVSR